MGEILKFSGVSKRIPRAELNPNHSAQILFFTGVRYVPYRGDRPEKVQRAPRSRTAPCAPRSRKKKQA